MRHDNSIDLKINGNEQVEKVKVGRGKWGKTPQRQAGGSVNRIGCHQNLQLTAKIDTYIYGIYWVYVHHVAPAELTLICSLGCVMKG